MILVSIAVAGPDGAAVGTGSGAPPLADSDNRTVLPVAVPYPDCGETDDLSWMVEGVVPMQPAAATTAMHTTMSAMTL